ncbi:MAG: hypothetical protein XU10_C0049G0006 [Chloroflexi bacterium CSP1-4]|nr:MAG: hypothetical protein XU10_C0049G0006 [Chloroflexi bacterium CSP1-4]
MTAGAAVAPASTGRGPWPLYASLLAAAFILNIWVEADISPYAMFRSLAVGLVVPALIALVAGALLRSRHLGGAVAGLIIVILVGWYAQLMLAVLLVLLGVVLVLLRRIRRAPIPWPRVSRALNAFAAALLVALAVKAAMHGTLWQALADLHQGTADLAASTVSADPTPDIYILLMDGYPRVDTVARIFDYDGEPFLQALEQRGLDVSRRSRTNYGVTQLTLVSMFEMRLLGDIPALERVLDGRQEAQPAMRNLTNDGAAVRFLKDRGYRIFATSPGFEEVALRRADTFIDDGQLNEFETILIRITGVADLIDLVAPDAIGDSFRSRVMATQAHAALAVEAARAGPQLAFIHVPSPHAPILFGADGARPPVDANHPYEYWLGEDTTADRIRAAYREQLPIVEDLVLKTIDIIRAGSEQTPVIIVFSDHGSLANLDTDPELKLSERVSNLFAASTPGHPRLFGDVVTPVNVFPILFDAYFGTDLPRSEDRSLVSESGAVFDFTELRTPDQAPP